MTIRQPLQVTANQWVRSLRGGSQPQLLQAAEDRRWYVVKFLRNPQHRRVLLNDWIGTLLLHAVGVACPRIAAVRLEAELQDRFPLLRSVSGGAAVHFGSEFPGDPARQAVFDLLPAHVLLEKVENVDNFIGALIVDKWASNVDLRQAIFFRSQLNRYLSAARPRQVGFLMCMIDQGMMFAGSEWTFWDGPHIGLYPQRDVYARIRSLDDFQPWLDRVMTFPESSIAQIIDGLPPDWLERGDRDALCRLCDRLVRRRSRIIDLLQSCRREVLDAFPNWQPTRKVAIRT